MISDYHVSAKAVMTRGAEVLVLRSKNTPDLPGGRIEAGETPITGLNRELSEALPGIVDIEIRDIVGWHLYKAYQPKGKNLIVLIFKVYATLPDPIQLSDEHESFEWLTIAEAKEALKPLSIFWNQTL
jgi:8-oxo-dGTP pyrophosphatase MutT (NUDIX family)